MRGGEAVKILILMGSPRKQGNTAALLRPFREELERLGAETETIWLYDQDILPCVACRTCQRDWTVFAAPGGTMCGTSLIWCWEAA